VTPLLEKDLEWTPLEDGVPVEKRNLKKSNKRGRERGSLASPAGEGFQRDLFLAGRGSAWSREEEGAASLSKKKEYGGEGHLYKKGGRPTTKRGQQP